jgi:hypothetical protein
VRTPLILAVAGILLGVAIALGAHELQSTAVGGPYVCTAQSLGLSPTVAIDKKGVATVGLATANGNCVVGKDAKRTVRILVASALGEPLLDRAEQRGPRAGTGVDPHLVYAAKVPAARLCDALQPLHFQVWAAGVTAGGEQVLRFDHGRCTIPS